MDVILVEGFKGNFCALNQLRDYKGNDALKELA